MFNKKTEAEIVAEDRALTAKNSDAVGKLVMLIDGDAELMNKLKDLREKLKYLKPVKTQEEMEADKKIASIIDDLKIELSRRSVDKVARVDRLISDIILQLVNRND